jgi:hypothetical protein
MLTEIQSTEKNTLAPATIFAHKNTAKIHNPNNLKLTGKTAISALK